MKILFVVNSLSIGGGMEIVTLHKLNALSEIPGIEVACAYTDKGDFPQEQIRLSSKVPTFDLDVHTWEIHGSMSRMLKEYIPRMWRLRRRLKKIISNWKPDVVVSVGSFEKYIIPTFFGRVGKHRFSTVREYHFASNFRNGRNTKVGRAHFLSWLDQIFLTRFYDKNYLLTQEDLENNFKPDAPRMGMMPNPLTVELPTDLRPMYDRPKRVVTVGRLVDQKNPEDAIRVWGKVNTKDWNLRLVGEGDKRPILEKMVEDLNLQSSVQLPGWSKDVAAELDDSRILIMTSRYEGFGLAIIEAMAHGVVPVCYACPYGPRDIITDGEDGFLVEVGDVEGMANKVCQLMDDTSLLQRMSEAAFRRAHDFELPRIASRWAQEYRKLIIN